MNADKIKGFRERMGWSQSDLAETLNATLGKRYTSATVSGWELGRRNLPAHVAAFLDALALSPDDAANPLSDGVAMGPGAAAAEEDTAPGADPSSQAAGSVPLSSSGIYKRACTELWEIIAAGVGMAGAATNSPKLMRDGQIIDADKHELGEAWGKLAETNETFRNMLIGMTAGGAWIQVCVVTGSTVARLYHNHAEPEGGYGAGLSNGSPPEPDLAAA